MQYPKRIAAVAKAATAGAKDTALPQQQILAGLKKQGNKQRLRRCAVASYSEGGTGANICKQCCPPPPPPPPPPSPGPEGLS